MLSTADLGLTVADDGARQRVEHTIATTGACGQPWLDNGLRPLLTRPGKRLRPGLVFAAAACGPELDREALINCSASVELMHLSSLVHDDLMDNSASRTGLPTLHVTSGPDAAILAGDHLLGVGGRLAATVSGKSSQAWQTCYTDLCAGQIRETANRYRTTTTMAEYLAAINGKTAALMRTSCELGARCGGLDDAGIAALARFGEMFGMVFQLVDDLMDIVSTEQLWRKPIKQDLANGVYTASVLATLRDPESELHELLTEKMTPAAIDRANERTALTGVDPAIELIEEHVLRAERALEALPVSAEVTRLMAMPRRYAFHAVSSATAPEYQFLVGSLQATSSVTA
ncbi:polyprenyl synthetase family protein [Amycolatopsis speibonae]|uniref:Polyprenyl synthetase family protein n=1 Tax=Amycolatopsis speibonae TaxID=1450224 RepID=A0ABV7PDS5_9PSEU